MDGFQTAKMAMLVVDEHPIKWILQYNLDMEAAVETGRTKRYQPAVLVNAMEIPEDLDIGDFEEDSVFIL